MSETFDTNNVLESRFAFSWPAASSPNRSWRLPMRKAYLFVRPSLATRAAGLRLASPPRHSWKVSCRPGQPSHPGVA